VSESSACGRPSAPVACTCFANYLPRVFYWSSRADSWVGPSRCRLPLAAWSQLETSLQPDRSVLLFTLGILAFAASIFGLAPLRSALSAPVGLALKSSGAAATLDKHKSRFGRILVAAQMAMCIVLLVAAGLLLRTLRNLETVRLGMRTQGLLVFGINPEDFTPTRRRSISRLYWHACGSCPELTQ